MTWKPGQPLVLETDNFILRSMAAADVDERFVGWFADPTVMEHVALPMNLSGEHLRRFAAGFDNRSTFLLRIHARPNDLPVGYYRVWCYVHYGYAKTAVVIGERDYWGRRTVLETRARLLDFLFDDLRLHKVTGAVYTRNMAAVFNYKVQGFRCEGILREQERSRDGRWLDVYLFGLLQREWKARS